MAKIIADAIGVACLWGLLWGGLVVGHGLGLDQPQHMEVGE